MRKYDTISRSARGGARGPRRAGMALMRCRAFHEKLGAKGLRKQLNDRLDGGAPERLAAG